MTGMMEREQIYSDNISDIAMEISISHVWRERIFALKGGEVLKLSANDKDIIPEYIRDVIVDNQLSFTIQIVDKYEEEYDEGLVIFKFSSDEFPKITAYSGNNPLII